MLLKTLYRQSLSLLTDLYELTMAYGYWKHNLLEKEACFQLFFRKYPFGGGYAIAAGMQVAMEFLENFRFDSSDLEYLAGLKNPGGGALFEPAFLKYLENFTLELDVDAVEEGTPVFPYEPILRVKGPILQAQIMESALLNIINFQTLIATKASRICYAAKGDHIVEFGLRRAQGIDGAIAASRASFIGGVHSTSNVLAGKLFDIPVMGTMAHSWVMSFDEEKESFEKFAKASPKNCVFLIDTYDSLKGVEKAIEVAKAKGQEMKMLACRLDSGDLNLLSQEVRKKLDRAGFNDTQIMATNELTEEIIEDLKNQGAKISFWGVGTNLVTAKDQPALDGVYKLSAVKEKDWKYRLKTSEQVIKTTNPGISQIRRFFDKEKPVADMVYDEMLGAKDTICHHTDPSSKISIDPSWTHKDLLVPMIKRGSSVYTHPSLKEMREKTYKELEKFPSGMRKLFDPEKFYSGLEESLFKKKLEMIEEIQNK